LNRVHFKFPTFPSLFSASRKVAPAPVVETGWPAPVSFSFLFSCPTKSFPYPCCLYTDPGRLSREPYSPCFRQGSCGVGPHIFSPPPPFENSWYLIESLFLPFSCAPCGFLFRGRAKNVPLEIQRSEPPGTRTEVPKTLSSLFFPRVSIWFSLLRFCPPFVAQFLKLFSFPPDSSLSSIPPLVSLMRRAFPFFFLNPFSWSRRSCVLSIPPGPV